MRTGLESIFPDNSKFSINMHYQSDSTSEFATFRINKSMSIEHILDLYAKLCPIECEAFLAEVRTANQQLYRPGGMSKEGVLMAIGRIPKIVMMMIEFLDPNFFVWNNGRASRNFIRFVRAFPKFAVGDHSLKPTGVLVK